MTCESQAGYNHAWDTHGGGAYLHQHLIDDYVSCWQQGLANGEIDASSCDVGTSRWFNYYLEGASYFLASISPCICSVAPRVLALCSVASHVLALRSVLRVVLAFARFGRERCCFDAHLCRISWAQPYHGRLAEL
jgi:hypothetical protein